ncbi:MAG TPA: ribonuclease E/G, partial [Hypericibacter adhaerens]|nr:ribonuclease E/G [Hypericibacter adhaerens]
MTKHMLIDATHPEETRVVVVSGKRLEEFDAEIASKKPLKGNIYLAKVVRVEPSLQAAFVDYGGNRHGFLAFNEIHPDYYRIPMADREALQAELEAEAAANERAEEDDDEAEDSVHAKTEGAERVESEPVADDADLIDSTESEAEREAES